MLVAGLITVYLFHIKNNEHNFRKAKLQRLDSFFDNIERQLDNKVQEYHSTVNHDNELAKSDGDSTQNSKLDRSIWYAAQKIATNFSLKEQEFGHYILVIKKPQVQKVEKDKKGEAAAERKDSSVSEKDIIYESCIKGSRPPNDSLFRSDMMNIGISIPVPKEKSEYQLFGKTYRYESKQNQGRAKPDTAEESIKYDINIIGLIELQRYEESIKKLDPWVISLLTTFLLLALFGLPYFKLLFIAEDERLSSTDVISAGVSVVVGAPIMVVIFLAIMNHYYDYNEIVPERLKVLSDDIAQKFEKENNDNVTALYKMSLNKEDSEYMASIQKNPLTDLDSVPYETTCLTNIHLINNFKFVTRLRKDNSSSIDGKSLYHIALIDNDEIKYTKDLSRRPYFIDYNAAKNRWVSDDVGTDYVMRSVVSIEGQTEEAVYILENKNDKFPGYRVGASQLKSVHEPILPFGYQFAIIDEEGEVWFHSEKGRATLENLFQVSRQPDKLKGAVTGRINAGGLLDYRDQSKLFNTTPVAGTNLTVVSLYDLALIRVRVSEVLTLASLAIILAVMLILTITVLSLIIKNPKLGLFKYDRFLFDFLTPKKEKKDTYILLSLLFSTTLLIAIIVGTFLPIAPSKVFIICLLMAMWAYLITFYALQSNGTRYSLKFGVRDLLILCVIGFLNYLMLTINPKSYELVIPAILIQLVFIFLIARGHRRSLPDRINQIRSYNPLNIRIGYKYWYATFLFIWLLLAAVYPAYLIFEKAQDVNDKIWYKADQLHMAKEIVRKERNLVKNLKAYPNLKESYTKLYLDHLNYGLYPKSLQIVQHESYIPELEEIAVDTLFREFLWKARPLYDKRMLEFQALAYQQAFDRSWSSREDLDDLALNLQYLDKKGGVALECHQGANFMNVGPVTPYLKGLGFLILLALLFSLILFFVDRFFAFRFRYLKPNDPGADHRKDYFKKFADILGEKTSNSGLLLIGPPFTGKRTFANKVIAHRIRLALANNKITKAEDFKTTTLSMLSLDNIDGSAPTPEILKILALDLSDENGQNFDWQDTDIFIVEHLEHNIKSFGANHIKLQIISFLMSHKKRVILTSEVYPSQIFAMYENPPQEPERSSSSYEDDFNSWRNILSAFPQVLIGISKNQNKVYDLLKIGPKHSNVKYEKKVAHLAEELGHSKFLPTLAPVVLAKSLYKRKDDDDQKGVDPDIEDQFLGRQSISSHAQNLAQGYYNDIRNALPTQERQLLYELAKDGFLNLENRNDDGQNGNHLDLENQHLDRQRMVMHTQNLAHGYYNDIWNALPTRERYLLYDLAKDGFLNIKNRNSLFSLMKKGLVVWKDRPVIFNDSFKNFIYTSVSLNEALRLEKRSRANGSWGNIRILFYLMILTVIVFIAMGRPELFKDFETLITALGGLGVIIPLVSKLLASGALKS